MIADVLNRSVDVLDSLNRTLDDSKFTEHSTKCNSTACAARQALATKGCI